MASEDLRVNDNHTLYIICGPATENQVRCLFNDFVTSCKALIPLINPEFHLNYIKRKNARGIQIAFLYFKDSSLYHMILGRNPNGSERVEVIEESSVEEYDFDSIPTFDDDIKPLSWSEITSDIPEIKTVALEPLVKFPLVQLNEEQQKISGEEYYQLSIKPSIYKQIEDQYFSNILKAGKVPNWVTVHDIVTQFRPFNNSVNVYGKEEIPYPAVFMIDGTKDFNDVYVVYDQRTHDAFFALQLRKVTLINKKFREGVKSTTLIFNHCCRNDKLWLSIENGNRNHNKRNQKKPRNRNRNRKQEESFDRTIAHEDTKDKPKEWNPVDNRSPFNLLKDLEL